MKELIERLRFQTRYTQGQVPVTMDEAADALERLTQPVDVEAVAYLNNKTGELSGGWDAILDPDGWVKLYSAEQVARLEQEVAETKLGESFHDQQANAYAEQVAHWIDKYDGLKAERDELLAALETTTDRHGDDRFDSLIASAKGTT